MKNFNPNRRILNSIEVLIKVLAESPDRFRELPFGF